MIESRIKSVLGSMEYAGALWDLSRADKTVSVSHHAWHGLRLELQSGQVAELSAWLSGEKRRGVLIFKGEPDEQGQTALMRWSEAGGGFGVVATFSLWSERTIWWSGVPKLIDGRTVMVTKEAAEELGWLLGKVLRGVTDSYD